MSCEERKINISNHRIIFLILNSVLLVATSLVIIKKRFSIYPYGKKNGTISLPPNSRDEIYFDSIYSHPLSSDKQKDKVFALEAMHDLRPDTSWRFLKGAIKTTLIKIKNTIKGDEDSFFRKAIRSNELFFVVKLSNLYNKSTLNKIIGEI